MMNVKIQTSTSTKNNTVNAVGNRNRRLGSAVPTSGRACVSAVTALPPPQRGSRMRGRSCGAPSAAWALGQLEPGGADNLGRCLEHSRDREPDPSWLTPSAGGDGFQILYETSQECPHPPGVIFVHSRTFAVRAAVPGLV